MSETVFSKIKKRFFGYLVRLNKYLKAINIAHTPDNIFKDKINDSLLDIWREKNPSNDMGDMTRLYFFINICAYLRENNIQGDIAEVGVYKGTTGKVLKELLPSVNIHLFDTFKGFSQEDVNCHEKRGSLLNEFLDTSLLEVKKFIGDDKRTFFYEGCFPDTVGNIAKEIKFSIVHLDADLYQPIKSGCEYFYPKLSKGGCLVIHDYYNTYYDGVKKAVDEYFQDRLEIPLPVNDKSGSVVIIKLH